MSNKHGWYGWIPILTKFITITINQGGRKSLSDHPPALVDYEAIIAEGTPENSLDCFLTTFCKALPKSSKFTKDLRQLHILYKYKSPLTDKWTERFCQYKHSIIITLEKGIGYVKPCPSCQEKTINLSVSIYKSNGVDVIIKANAYIHSNGLVYYSAPPEQSLHYLINQAHKAIRDIFHCHLNHKSDLLLPTTEAIDDNEALNNFQKTYITKFLLHKKLIKHWLTNNIVRDYTEAIKLIFISRGELIYAKNLITLINKSDSKHTYFFEAVTDTLSNLEKLLDNEKSSYMTLTRVGLSFIGLMISISILFSCYILDPIELFRYRFTCFFAFVLFFAWWIALGSRYINIYRHRWIWRLITFSFLR